MDIVEMPQEDYSRDSEVRAFENTYRAGGIGLDMQELSYRYNTGTEVFSHATVEAYPHEIVALVGPSGEGKTTMLRLILSLLKPQGGDAWVKQKACNVSVNQKTIFLCTAGKYDVIWYDRGKPAQCKA